MQQRSAEPAPKKRSAVVAGDMGTAANGGKRWWILATGGFMATTALLLYTNWLEFEKNRHERIEDTRNLMIEYRNRLDIQRLATLRDTFDQRRLDFLWNPLVALTKLSDNPYNSVAFMEMVASLFDKVKYPKAYLTWANSIITIHHKDIQNEVPVSRGIQLELLHEYPQFILKSSQLPEALTKYLLDMRRRRLRL